jgi:hypothetical protein
MEVIMLISINSFIKKSIVTFVTFSCIALSSYTIYAMEEHKTTTTEENTTTAINSLETTNSSIPSNNVPSPGHATPSLPSKIRTHCSQVWNSSFMQKLQTHILTLWNGKLNDVDPTFDLKKVFSDEQRKLLLLLELKADLKKLAQNLNITLTKNNNASEHEIEEGSTNQQEQHLQNHSQTYQVICENNNEQQGIINQYLSQEAIKLAAQKNNSPAFINELFNQVKKQLNTLSLNYKQQRELFDKAAKIIHNPHTQAQGRTQLLVETLLVLLGLQSACALIGIPVQPLSLAAKAAQLLFISGPCLLLT